MMIQLKKPVVLYLLFYVCYVQSSENLAQFLPVSSVEGKASYIGFDLEVEKIAQKFQEAMQKDTAWLEAYMKEKKVQPGEMLPHHPNLGITEQEYGLVTSSLNKLKLVSLGDVSILVQPIEGSKKVKISGQHLSLTFVLDSSSNEIQTNRAILNKYTIIDQNDTSSPLGTWTGEQWQALDEGNGFSEKIALGKQDGKDTGIIYYDVKSPAEGIESHYIITYPLK